MVESRWSVGVEDVRAAGLTRTFARIALTSRATASSAGACIPEDPPPTGNKIMTASPSATKRGWSDADAVKVLALHGSSVSEVDLDDAVCPGPERAIRIRDHLPLGTGDADYASFLNRLQADGFDGPVILEITSIVGPEQGQLRLGPGQFG